MSDSENRELLEQQRRQDPQERMADSFEAIASQLQNIHWDIKSHAEAVAEAGRRIGEAVSELAAATPREPKENAD